METFLKLPMAAKIIEGRIGDDFKISWREKRKSETAKRISQVGFVSY